MTSKMISLDYAEIADDVYNRNKLTLKDDPAILNGDKYDVIAVRDNPKTGYQGAVYQRVDTGEIIVAHRGTELKKTWDQKWPDLKADIGMVISRSNAQDQDAIELTRWAIKESQKLQLEPQNKDKNLTVTTTGHSLGGTLAQISAHHFDLKGETFNAYGAAGLARRIPEGGSNVENHVMAGDPVSAASPHFGQLKMYAHPNELAVLTQNHAPKSLLQRMMSAISPIETTLGNPVAIAANVSRDATQEATAALRSGAALQSSHSMHLFTTRDELGKRDVSILQAPQTVDLAQKNKAIIDNYRAGLQNWAQGAGHLSAAFDATATTNSVNQSLQKPMPAGEPALQEQQKHQQDQHRLQKPQPNATPPALKVGLNDRQLQFLQAFDQSESVSSQFTGQERVNLAKAAANQSSDTNLGIRAAALHPNGSIAIAMQERQGFALPADAARGEMTQNGLGLQPHQQQFVQTEAASQARRA